ncbi:hypothetical protein [Pseudooceanicola nanhaiensis]|uniref:hypothetical protein n=1 Tax=Pseudooceanicola nanhaiensis TaxID=375761 RepID=UPI001CD46700|nr:hypothetical protein [Pseudooceanicola nanhaiensis]MCA0921424.1 hypothetical protein [Pseudooceanicola nanhaiensis]
MEQQLAQRFRLLKITMLRYESADREWRSQLASASSWFPAAFPAKALPIGNPGSRLRLAYEKRSRALMQFEAARDKLHVARRRLAGSRPEQTRVTLLIAPI